MSEVGPNQAVTVEPDQTDRAKNGFRDKSGARQRPKPPRASHALGGSDDRSRGRSRGGSRGGLGVLRKCGGGKPAQNRTRQQRGGIFRVGSRAVVSRSVSRHRQSPSRRISAAGRSASVPGKQCRALCPMRLRQSSSMAPASVNEPAAPIPGSRNVGPNPGQLQPPKIFSEARSLNVTNSISATTKATPVRNAHSWLRWLAGFRRIASAA